VAVLGLISIFQIVFIPGYILLRILKFSQKSLIRTIVYSFGLSLLINYMIVFLLTLIGIYRPETMYIIFSLELLLLIYLFIKDRSMVNKTINLLEKNSIKNLSENILIKISILIIIIFIYFFISNFGKIFSTWDAVFSWNRWAVYWFYNELPNTTGFYPQLIPANWSLTYVFMQKSDIQLFSKLIMPLFPLGVILLFFDIAKRKKNITYLMALIIYCILVSVYGFIYIQGGYVDIPVAFFAFASFLLLYEKENTKLEINEIFIIIAFASAAAVVKQAGFFILIIVTIWLYWQIVKNNFKIKKLIKSIIIPIITIPVILSWYLIKIFEVNRGIDYSNTGYLINDIHGGLNYLQRILRGIGNLPDKGLVLFLIFILLILSLLVKKIRWVTIFIIFPFLLIWGFYFSYDSRNLALAYPFIAFSSAFGINFLINKFTKDKALKNTKDILKRNVIKNAFSILLLAIGILVAGVGIYFLFIDKTDILLETISKLRGTSIVEIWSTKLQEIYRILMYIGLIVFLFAIFMIIKDRFFAQIRLKIKYLIVIFSIFFIIVGVFIGLNTEKIVENQINLRKKLGDPVLNEMLYDYKSKNEINGRIITDYYWLSVIPEFYDSPKDIFINNKKIQIISNVEPYSPFLTAVDANTWGFLISDDYYHNDLFADEIETKISNNEYIVIFKEQGYTIKDYYFIKISK